MLDYLNKGGNIEPSNVPATPELEQLRDKAIDHAREISRFDSLAPDFTAENRAIAEADRRYYTRQHFEPPPPTSSTATCKP